MEGHGYKCWSEKVKEVLCRYEGKLRFKTVAQDVWEVSRQAAALEVVHSCEGHIFAADRPYPRQSKSKTYKVYFVSRNLFTFFQYMNAFKAEERAFYELLEDARPVRPYFDIDVYVNTSGDAAPLMKRLEEIDTMQNTICQRLQAFVNQSLDDCTLNMLVLKSDGQVDENRHKISRHLIFSGVLFPCTVQLGRLVKHMFGDMECVDKAVYTKNRLFRMVGNSKLGSARLLECPVLYDGVFCYQSWVQTLVSSANKPNLTWPCCSLEALGPEAKRAKPSPPDLLQWVTDTVLPHVEGSNQVSLAGELPTEDGVTIFNFTRNTSENPCFLTKRNGSGHIHQNNRTFSVIVNATEQTVFYRCLGTNGHPEGKSSIQLECQPPDASDSKIVLKTHHDIKVLFKSLYVHKFRLYRGAKGGKELYYYNGVSWQPDMDYDTLYEYLGENLRTHVELLNCSMKSKKMALKMLTNADTLKKLCNMIVRGLPSSGEKFETNAHLFAFKDRIYDLYLDRFVEPHPDQNVLITTGYNYKAPTEQQVQKVRRILEQVHVDKPIRDLYGVTTATGLFGQTLEKFILNNGNGRNGKGVTNEMTCASLGDYAYKLENSVLSAKNSDAPSVAKANLNYKRFVIATEPDAGTPLNISVIKELTGGNEINARTLYSIDTVVNLKCTLVLECNDKPALPGNKQTAERDRIIDLPFKSQFVDTDLSVEERRFKKSAQLKSKTFQEEHRCAMFHVLLDYWRMYKDADYCIDSFVTDEIRERNEEYFMQSDDIYRWFFENFQVSETDTDIVDYQFIWNLFDASTMFQNMTARKKREYSKSKVLDHLCKVPRLKMVFKSRERRVEALSKWIKRRSQHNAGGIMSTNTKNSHHCQMCSVFTNLIIRDN